MLLTPSGGFRQYVAANERIDEIGLFGMIRAIPGMGGKVAQSYANKALGKTARIEK